MTTKEELKKECKKRLYGKYRPICIVSCSMVYNCDKCHFYHRNIGKHIENPLQFTDENLKQILNEKEYWPDNFLTEEQLKIKYE